jgi:hypothetical protein
MLILLAAATVLLALPALLYAADAPPQAGPVELALPPAEPGLRVVCGGEERSDALAADGYQVYGSINDALADAPMFTHVFICAGTYHEEVLLEDARALTISGELGATLIAHHDSHAVWLIGCADITVRNLAVVHTWSEDACSHNCFALWHCHNVLIEGCDISGCGYIGIEATGYGGYTTSRAVRCEIHNCEYGVYREPAGTLLLEGCLLHSNNEDYWE